MMRNKLFKYVFVLLSSLAILSGCANESQAPATNETTNEASSEVAEDIVTITLSLDEGAEVIEEKEIEIEEKDILMDVMKENFDIEEEGGFIHSINGVAPEEGEKKAWIYFVNDEMAMVGAAEYELTVGDHVVFDLQSWE